MGCAPSKPGAGCSTPPGANMPQAQVQDKAEATAGATTIQAPAVAAAKPGQVDAPHVCLPQALATAEAARDRKANAAPATHDRHAEALA